MRTYIIFWMGSFLISARLDHDCGVSNTCVSKISPLIHNVSQVSDRCPLGYLFIDLTPEREVGGSIPTPAVLCPGAKTHLLLEMY